MSGDGLRARVVRGAAWKVLSQVVQQATRVLVAVVLARLLTPVDYGLAAMVLAFSLLVYIFSDLALGAALVQRRELSDDDRSTAFWISVGAGALFTVAGILAAPVVARFYGDPDVEPLFAAMSASFLITALGTTQSALLEREMSFGRLEVRRMAGIVVGAVAGISVAAAGYGAWAIIAQQIAIAAVSTALIWVVSDWRPRVRVSRASLRSLLGFSANVFGSRVVFYLNRNVDNLLIGRYVGAAGLGAYALAYNVMLVPFNQVAGPLQEVLFPAFARMQGDRERMTRAWMTVNRLVGAISIPALTGLAIACPVFVPVVLGDRWSSAITVIQVLCWVGLLQSLQRLNSSILLALGRSATLLRYSVFALAGSLVGFVAGLHWGIVGVSVGYAAASTVIEPVYMHITARAIGTSLWRMVASLSGIAQATAAMAAVMLILRAVLDDRDAGNGAQLATLVLAGTVAYAAVVLRRDREVARHLAALRRRLRPGRAVEPPVADPAPAATETAGRSR